MMKFKMKSCTICLALILSLVSGCSSQDKASSLKDGTYSAEVSGMHAMNVEVEIKGDKINNIKVDHEETPGVGEPAVDYMVEKILSNQALGIDVMSGATLTSKAILEGVKKNALKRCRSYEAFH